MSTQSSDLSFEPKVWSDHITAYFDKKLVYGAFAFRPTEKLKEDAGSGLTVNFPFYKQIGEAEEPEEDESLTVDKLQDDSFSATVFEVGKALGINKKAFKKSADGENGMLNEAHSQLARVMAEKVDSKLNTEITDDANLVNGYTATAAANVMTVKTLLRGQVVSFGDKNDEAIVCFMHSFQYLDMMVDAGAGFLKADASDPMAMVKGYKGRTIHGMVIIVVDSVPQVADIDGKSAYKAHFHKVNSFGFMEKQEMEFDEDKDILTRQRLVTTNQWYTVKSFHAKISADDKKAGSIITTIS